MWCRARAARSRAFGNIPELSSRPELRLPAGRGSVVEGPAVPDRHKDDRHKEDRHREDGRKEDVDADALAHRLRAHLRGDVRFDNGTRALYATDGSNYRQVPIGVVLPRDNDDVLAAIALCREFNAPLLCRGAGTSLAGQCCNVAVILDFSRYMSSILEIDPTRHIARVQPGVVLDNLRNAAEKHHLTFGPDPASHDRCTIGGMIGNNSCGVHSVMAGKTDENIEALEVVTYDGIRLKVGQGFLEYVGTDALAPPSGANRTLEIHSSLKHIADEYGSLIRSRFPNIPRRVSGYNLNYLLPENGFNIARALVGSEGTCVTVLEATCRLVESPPARVLVVIGYSDIYECADRIPEILAHQPIGLEGFDEILVACTRIKGVNPEGLALLPEGGGWLLAEFGGATAMEADSRALSLAAALNRSHNPPRIRIYSGAQAKRVWEVRESSLGVTSYVPGEPMYWEGWEDSAVTPEKLGAYLRDLRKLMNDFSYKGSFYGHFGHACVHTRVNFDLKSKEGIAKFRHFMEHAADLVIGYGGSLSGEHGDGQARAELLPKMFGPELMQAFHKFKSAWDPEWKMNPGKLIAPYKLDENLRLGADYKPWEPATNFRFPADQGSLAQAALRCVGVGKCRRDEGGVMCPSYRVTREEEHSTRGRAHLLWEMTLGEVIRDGWRSEEVKGSLDLCLACKGCKSDCPVGVDVATYKAEFLSHYYEGRPRPRSAYAFGNIDVWARLASHAPGLVNLTTQLPFLRDMAKFAAGVSPQRSIPAFAPETFRTWFGRRSQKWGGNTADPNIVILWPDTFNNYFHPATARAAVEVLEAAGFRVVLPRSQLCCGRPLYDFGMLDRAQALLLKILDDLSPAIAAGIPVVGLEPSCVAVFRDELLNFFPNDERAQALARQTFLLSEFLEQKLGSNSQAPLPQMNRRALLHGHCHHKSIMKMTAEESLLHRLGVDFQSPAAGCCGMAGSFGFERDKDKYEVSMAIGELELLPAVRRAPADWLIIADGFSCREQIAQGTDRRALHLAEVLQMALHNEPPTEHSHPESSRARCREAELRSSMMRAGLGLGALAAGGFLLWKLSRTR
jgi:FAD/FMN-containing dehydrogenase/Fe-S oxidoreductase